MSHEIGALSDRPPRRDDVVRVVGLAVPDVIASPGRIDESWDVTGPFGDAVVVTEMEPGSYEPGNVWYAAVAAIRTDGGRLLAVVTAAAIALLGDGVIVDDDAFIGGGHIDPRAVLQAVIARPDLAAAARLDVVRAATARSDGRRAED